MTPDFSFAINVVGFAAFVAGGIFYARSKVPSQTIANYKALAEAQEKRIKALEDQSKADQQNHIESVRAIAELTGQIKVYKELPLREMATAMQRISDTNQLILDRLNTGILADEKVHPQGKVTTTVITDTK